MSAELVLASSLAVTRNDATVPFPHVADPAVLDDLFARVRDVLQGPGRATEWDVRELEAISAVERAYLVERGVMTAGFSRTRGAGRGYALDRDSDVAIEINGGEHLRMLATRRGVGLSELWATIDEIDDEVEAAVEYAFELPWGYLMSRPAHAGTGLSAYATVHVPGLMVSGALGGVAMDLVGRGLALLPLWEGAGGIFQVSTRGGGGTSEEALIAAVETAAFDLVEREQTVRRVFVRDDPVRVRDHIGRSLGIAGHAWSVTTHEAISLVSAIQAGVSMGVVDAPWFTQDAAFSLMLRMLPGHVAVGEPSVGQDGLDDPRNDEIRARILRDSFAGMCVVE